MSDSLVRAEASPGLASPSADAPRSVTKPDASADPPCPLVRDLTDIVLYAAVAMLPVDGTWLGVSLPYWTPISPWLFALYAALNWRHLRIAVRRYLPVFVFPVLLVATSFYGWKTIGVHPGALAKSFISIGLFLACLASLEIGVRIKRLSVRRLCTVLFATYCLAFVVGVLQYLALKNHLDWQPVRAYFWHLLARPYTWGRPQFLFAEPSYIGMHLFGVLLPVCWLTRDRRIGVLVPVFAIGAIAMGSGTRIVLDSIVAVFIWLLAAVNFHSRRATFGFVGAMGVIAVGGLAAVAANPRLNALATQGLLAGDGSMSARIFHMLAPMWSWKHDLSHWLFGWSAGNISDAVRAGYAGARRWYDAHGGMVNAEIEGLANPPANTFTMSAYASFITEFGLVCFCLLVVMILALVTRWHAWSRTAVCWLLLLAYLYIQFESYAFYALPLFIWAMRSPKVPASERGDAIG